MSATMSLLLSLFMITLTRFVPSSSLDPSDEAKGFADCSLSKYRCGPNTYEIYYPFRLPDSPYYCGHPEFNLICNDNTTLFTSIGGKEYRVNSINYITRVLNVTDYNFADANEACPKTFTNTSLNLTLFEYSRMDTNLITIYFNCSPAIQSILPYFPLHNISCLATQYGFESFYGLTAQSPPMTDVLKFCNSTVVVPVSNLAMNEINDLWMLLRQGFGLTWKVDEGWCGQCTDSGGVCGNDPNTTDGEACFCSNATITNGSCVSIGKNTTRIEPKTNKNKTMIMIGIGTG